MHDRRPSYAYGAIIPLKVARWFYLNPVDNISIVPEAEQKTSRSSVAHRLRFHSGDKHIDHYCNWGIQLTDGRDRQGRASLVDLQHHETVAEIVEWERRQQAAAA